MAHGGTLNGETEFNGTYHGNFAAYGVGVRVDGLRRPIVGLGNSVLFYGWAAVVRFQVVLRTFAILASNTGVLGREITGALQKTASQPRETLHLWDLGFRGECIAPNVEDADLGVAAVCPPECRLYAAPRR